MTTPSKRLLLFTGKLGYQTRSFEESALKLGVQLVYVTDRCHQLEDPWGDRAIAVHFENPEVAAYTVMESLRGQNVDGILALGDRPAAAASYAARGLGISYNHPAPEPSLLGISYPCVLKPLSLSASQGVVRVNNREEFLAAASRVRRLLESPEIRSTREPNLDQLLVEGYIPGREVAVEGLVSDGALRVLAIFDKPDPLEGPYFEETIYVTPSRLPDVQQHAIEQCARDAARALGISQGPIHAEFRINEDGVWPLELAPRPIGGLCARALRFFLDSEEDLIGLEELLMRRALEFPGSDSQREQLAAGVMMIPVLKSGVLEAVSGEDVALAVPGITDLLITARLHDYIAAWPEGSSYLGFLFARGAHPEEVEQAIRKAHEKLAFTITPRLPLEHPAARRMTSEGS